MKYDPHSNRRDVVIPGIAALRSERVNVSGVPNISNQMLRAAPNSSPRTRFGYYIVAATAAAAVCGALLLPRKSSAMSIHEVARAAGQFASWYEQTYRPDSSGKLQLVLEDWNAPGKRATLQYADGRLDFEERFNGKVEYRYDPANEFQRIAPWGSEGFPLSTIEGFGEYRLLAVRQEGKLLRYVFAIHQDLLVDPVTKLPVERDVYHADGSILEIHKIFLTHHIDESLFEADLKPDVRLVDIPAEQALVKAKFSEAPMTQVVGGIKVKLYALIVEEHQSIGAVVVGGASHPPGAPEHMQVVGVAAPESRSTFDSDPWPGTKEPLVIDGQVAHVERVGWLQRPPIPDRFTLRMPVWKPHSKFAGWAEFDVRNPIRAEGIDEVLPNFIEPGIAGTGVTSTP